MPARRVTSRKRQHGVTLVEVLVAVTVLAIVLIGILRALDHQSASTIALADRMFAHWVALNSMKVHPVLAIESGGEALLFTRGGLPNPAGLPRSGFQRIRYAFNRNAAGIERQVWRWVDPAPLQRAEAETLLDGVERVRFRVWTGGSGWLKTWPDPGDPTTRTRLPEGIEAVLHTRRFGLVRRVVSLR